MAMICLPLVNMKLGPNAPRDVLERKMVSAVVFSCVFILPGTNKSRELTADLLQLIPQKRDRIFLSLRILILKSSSLFNQSHIISHTMDSNLYTFLHEQDCVIVASDLCLRNVVWPDP